MKLVKPWLPPIAAAFAVVGLVVSVGKWEPLTTGAPGIVPFPAPTERCEGYPWGSGPNDRIMNVVLDDDGAYIGTRRIPYEAFRGFMIKNAQIWRPDRVMISGTQNSRIGHGIEVLDCLRLLQLYPDFSPIVVKAGTRLPEIELYRDGIPLEEWEQMEKDSAAR